MILYQDKKNIGNKNLLSWANVIMIKQHIFTVLYEYTFKKKETMNLKQLFSY